MTRCHRCPRRATHAVAVREAVIVLCREHAHELAEQVRARPVLEHRGRRVRLVPPRLEAER